MSYDVVIFFGENGPENLSSAAEITERIVGQTFSVSESHSFSLFGMSFDLHQRAMFLRDERDMPFSAFRYQLDITCPISRLPLIHPIGLFMAEEYSKHLLERSMLCLAGVEFLGAVFNKGRMVDDRMSSYQHLYAGTGWRYEAGDL